MGRSVSGRAIGGWTSLCSFVAVSVAVAGVLASLSPAAPAAAPLALSFRSVPLDPGRPGEDRVGRLRYRGGLWLRSSDPRFGGLSDVRVSADGRELRAVSDCGYGFAARVSYEADGRLKGLAEPRLVDLVGLRGRPLTLGERDSESLVVHDEALEVGFEGKARVWAYSREPPFAGPARAVPVPAGLAGCGSNGGIETMTMVDRSRRLLVCETRRSASLDVPAWIGQDGAWVERSYPLLFRGGWAGEPFRPTGAALLPDGDVLVVERRFPPIGCRVVRIARVDIEGRGPLHRVEIATFESPLTVDNFEGIDARRDSRGSTLVYLISDDNNCAKVPGGARGTGLQRTLLLMFSLEG